MDYRNYVSFGFAIAILAEGIIFLAKGINKDGKKAGILSVIAGVIFLAASVISLVEDNSPSDIFMPLKWILYIAGFVFFIIGLVFKKKSGSFDKK